jgi:hypothetical protein
MTRTSSSIICVEIATTTAKTSSWRNMAAVEQRTCVFIVDAVDTIRMLYTQKHPGNKTKPVQLKTYAWGLVDASAAAAAVAAHGGCY